MKDRSGLFVLAGAAANRASYEATPYERGLLTQAVLEGMAGAKLTNNRYVDVEPLLHYAVDKVVTMAAGLGGIQAPYVATPRDETRSFDIGLLDENARRQIPIHTSKPIVIRPTFLNRATAVDDLRLGNLVIDQLSDSSHQGPGLPPSYVYVDTEDLANGIRPSGLYELNGNSVSVTLALTRENQRWEEKISCPAQPVTTCAVSVETAIRSGVSALH